MKKKNEIVKFAELKFHGRVLLTAECDGIIYAAMKPVAQSIGLSWRTQCRKIRKSTKWENIMLHFPLDKGLYEMVALPLDQLNEWLISVNSEKVKPENRDMIISFQKEFCSLVYEYWILNKDNNSLQTSQKIKKPKNKNQIVKADEVKFNGQTVLTVKVNGRPYAAVKPIAENIGLDWKSQYQKIKDDQRWEDITIPLETSGGIQEMFCLPLEQLHGWLFSISPAKVRHEIRDIVIKYQKECFVVLHDYWTKGAAINPRFKNKSITTAKAHREFKNFAKNYKILGYGKAQAEIMAVDNLMKQYNYDYPASLGLTREKIVELITKKYRADFIDSGLDEWLNTILDDHEVWGERILHNIQGIYNAYVDFCKDENRNYKPFNGWSRKIRKIFQNHLKVRRKAGERNRYYEFADLQTCRKRFEEYIGKEIWPPSDNLLN